MNELTSNSLTTGYRNAYYKIGGDYTGQIWLSHWNDSGERIESVFSHKSHLYIEDERGDRVSLFGTRIKRYDFKNIIERKKFLEANQKFRVFESLPPVMEFLIERYAGLQECEYFSKYPLRKMFIDIEAVSENEFPMPDDAKYPVNLITVYDSLKEEYHCWVLNDRNLKLNLKKQPVNYHVFDNEPDMLMNWLMYMNITSPDVITGWNIIGFDIIYLVNRCNNIFSIDITADYLSPVDRLRPVYYQQRFGKGYNTYEIGGVSVLDYYLLYRHKFTVTTKESYKLGYIAKEELGVSKLDYAGSIYNFWKNDFDRFIEYNILDVELVVKLDEKLKYIDISRSICNKGLVEYGSIYYSKPAIYGALALQAISNGKHILSKESTGNVEIDEAYEGGFVFEPISGYYKNGVGIVDFNSLYPNIIIANNISPETKIGKVTEINENYVCIKRNIGGEKRITPAEYELVKKKCIKSANNVLYLKHDKLTGIIPQFCQNMYQKRVEKKQEIDMLTNKLQKLTEELKTAH